MVQNRSLFVMGVMLVLVACSSSPQKDLSNTPVNQSWVLGAPPHENRTPTKDIKVMNPETVEDRLARLENDMAKIKLDLTQLLVPKQYAKPMAPKIQKVSKKTGVRFGLNGGKTRIVFDLPYKVGFKIDLDNQEKFLLIELQGQDLGLHSGIGKGLVTSYDVDGSTNGVTCIALNLKDSVKIVTQEFLNPSGQYGHRVFLDIMHDL